MATPAAGEVVPVPFPFSDLKKVAAGVCAIVLLFALGRPTGQTDANAQQPQQRPQSQAGTAPLARTPAGISTESADKIRPVLPKGWTLDSEKSQLKISRDAPVEWYRPTRETDGLDYAEKKRRSLTHRSQFVITIDFAAPLTTAELDRMRDENSETWKSMDRISNKLAALDAWRRSTPRNAEERRLSAEYDKVRANLHAIPVFAMADSSVYVSQSVGVYTLFCLEDDREKCRQGLQTVETVFVRQTDPARASPEALAARFAAAIDNRDQKEILACFDVDPKSRDPKHQAIFAEQMLAALRLRDAMDARFGREATRKAWSESRWVEFPDTRQLRAAHWTLHGEEAGLSAADPPALGAFFYAVRVWWNQDRPGWGLGVGVPASGKLEEQQNAESQRFTELAKKLSEGVKAGTYTTAEEVRGRLARDSGRVSP